MSNIENRFNIDSPIYPETADKYCAIFNDLQIYDLLNTPKIGDLGRLWYRDFASFFFGSIELKNRIRLIQEFFVLIPKKNGKSTISGLIMLTALLANPYRGAEFALISPSREVTQNAFIPICEAIRLKQEKGQYLFLEIVDKDDKRYIKDKRTNAVLKVIWANEKIIQGKKFQGVLIDEIALWQKTVKNAHIILNEITGNLVNKKDAFLIYLTTQSSEPPQGVFKALLTKARRIAKGGLHAAKENNFYPILYEFSEKEIKEKAYLQPENWAKVNPNIGVSVSLDRLKQMQSDAIDAGQAALNEFYAKYLNVEITIADNIGKWQGADFWVQCEKRITLQQVIAKSNYLYIGIDGGGLDDLTGLAVLGIDNKGLWRIWATAYGYKSVLERKGLAKRLSDFQANGECLIVEKLGDDAKAIGELVAKIYNSKKLLKIGIDPRGIGDILSEIKASGTPENLIEPINQGTALMSAEKTLSRRLAQNNCIISQSDLMRFCVSNAVIEDRGDDYFLSKKSSQFKIDPLMALLNCVALFERYGVRNTVKINNSGLHNAIAILNKLNA